MPLYEFKCLECDEFFELLIMNKDEEIALKCPRCTSPELERVLSTANFAMGSASGRSAGMKSETRTCSSGSCTTYEIPGPTG